MPLFKKKLRDTKVAKFLKDKAPDILDGISDILPDKGLLGLAGNIIDRINKHDKLSVEDKEMALKLLEIDKTEMEQVTERWKSDLEHGGWLSQNSRPLVLLSAVLMLYVFIILDSSGIKFDIKESWISLYEVILVTTIGGYFGLRSWEKIKRK